MVKRMRRLWWAALLLVVMLALSSSAALAQGGGDKVVMGGNYELRSGETLDSSLLVLGGSAVLQPDSTVNGNVTVMGGSVEAAGTIHGDVSVIGGSVSLRNTAVVDGSLNTVGGSVNRAPGARVSGTSSGPLLFGPFSVPQRPPVVPIQPPVPPRSNPFAGVLGLIAHFFSALGLGLLMAIIGIVVVLLAPVSTGRVATAFGFQPALNFAVGLLTLVLATLIGFPLLIACGLGAVVWLLTFVAMVFGWIAAGLWLGQRLLHQVRTAASSSIGEVALGVFLLTWVTWVMPACLRWPLGIVIGSMGLGAVVMSRFGTWTGSGSWPFGTAQPAPQRGPAGSGPVPVTSLLPAEATAVTVAAASVAAERSPWAPPAASQPEVVESYDAMAPMVPPVAGNLAGTDDEPAPIMPAEPIVETVATPTPRAGSLEDLEAVQGITPDVGQRLRDSGNTTLVALATSDPESLARATGVDADRIRSEDWIGQARRLLG